MPGILRTHRGCCHGLPAHPHPPQHPLASRTVSPYRDLMGAVTSGYRTLARRHRQHPLASRTVSPYRDLIGAVT
jgi:hypothetical protein